MWLGREEFEELVSWALDGLPLAFAAELENIVIQVRDEPSRETIESLGLDPRRSTLFGLYTGVPLEHRGGFYGNVLPDVVLLYRGPLLRAFPTREGLARQVRLTLLHELGHHFGFSDAQMRAWEETV
jgi:predicted Zn-dependent protease with MMP-like domain